MNKSFDKLINEIASKRPIQKRGENPILFFDDHAVMLQAGKCLAFIGLISSSKCLNIG